MTSIRRVSGIKLFAAIAVVVALVATLLSLPSQAYAGDLDGVIGYRFKVHEGDDYTPPGDNTPSGNSTAVGSASSSVRISVAAPSSVERSIIRLSDLWWNWLGRIVTGR